MKKSWPWYSMLKHACYRGQLRSTFHYCCCCFDVSTYTRESSLIRTFHIEQPLLLLRGRLTVQLISTRLYKFCVRYTYLSRLRYRLSSIFYTVDVDESDDGHCNSTRCHTDVREAGEIMHKIWQFRGFLELTSTIIAVSGPSAS